MAADIEQIIAELKAVEDMSSLFAGRLCDRLANLYIKRRDLYISLLEYWNGQGYPFLDDLRSTIAQRVEHKQKLTSRLKAEDMMSREEWPRDLPYSPKDNSSVQSRLFVSQCPYRLVSYDFDIYMLSETFVWEVANNQFLCAQIRQTDSEDILSSHTVEKGMMSGIRHLTYTATKPFHWFESDEG